MAGTTQLSAGPTDEAVARPDTRARQLAEGLLFAVLVLACFDFPRFPDASIDPSWRMALTHAFLRDLQFGTDIVYTYGPLGFGMARTYAGEGWGWMVGLQLAMGVAMTLAVWSRGRDTNFTERMLYLAYFCFLAVISEEAFHVVVIGWLGVCLVGDKKLKGWNRQWVAVLLAGLSLVKFTNLMIAFFVLLVAAVFEIGAKRRGNAAGLLTTYVLAFVALWCVTGQSPLNIPAFLVNSFENVRGYDAMAADESGWILGLGLAGALCAVVGLLLQLALSRGRSELLATLVILGALVFISWKHGFTRADPFHTPAFFVVVGLPAVVAVTALAGKFNPGTVMLLLVAAGAGVAGLSVCRAVVPPHDGVWAAVKHHLVENPLRAVNYGATRQAYEAHLVQLRAENDLPRVRATVGRATVDVLGYELGVALFNGLNYAPRPALQSFQAYTSRLAELNGEYLTSARRPQFLLQKVQSIDNRLPGMDDARVLAQLPHGYEFLFEENGYALWRARAGAKIPAIETAEARKIRLGERVELPAEVNVWASFRLRPTWLGHLRAFFYHRPETILALEEAGGGSTWGMSPAIGETGFILSPVIDDTEQYLAFARNQPGRRVKAFTVKVPAEVAKFFEPELEVRLATLKSLAN